MWFRNLQVYRLKAGWNPSREGLEEQLGKFPFQPCGSTDMQSKGWTSPRGDEFLVHGLGGQIMVALGVEQKLLPSSVVNQLANERLDEIEEQQGYRPGRKQAREVKEAVVLELMPRAFARRRTSFAWIDPAHGWLAVDAASAAKAEEVLEMLTKTLPDLPLALLRTQLSPAAAMTSWLASGDAPPGFSIDRDCELRSPLEENATVRYVRHPLDAAEIGKHLADGKQPTRLAMTWDERISFVLTERLEIKRLAFLDILKEQADADAETAAEQFDADFALMTGELTRMIPALVEALGGRWRKGREGG